MKSVSGESETCDHHAAATLRSGVVLVEALRQLREIGETSDEELAALHNKIVPNATMNVAFRVVLGSPAELCFTVQIIEPLPWNFWRVLV